MKKEKFIFIIVFLIIGFLLFVFPKQSIATEVCSSPHSCSCCPDSGNCSEQECWEEEKESPGGYISFTCTQNNQSCAFQNKGPGVFYKGLPTPNTYVDNNLLDDKLSQYLYQIYDMSPMIPRWKYFMKPIVGIADKFFQAPYKNDCPMKDRRDYAFIYIPQGWWDFAIAGNYSTASNMSCYYCPNGDYCDKDGKVRWPCTALGKNEFQYAEKCYKDPSRACCHGRYSSYDCPGKDVKAWLGATGAGAKGNPYQAAISTKSTLEDRFAEINTWIDWMEFDGDNIIQTKPYNNTIPDDLIETTPKYYLAGWYPVETTYLDKPAEAQLLWKKYGDGNQPVDLGSGWYQYTESSQDSYEWGARFGDCGVGEIQCTITNLENKTVSENTSDTITGKIFNYLEGSFDAIMTSGGGIVTVTGKTVDASGNIAINIDVGDVAETIVGNLHATALSTNGITECSNDATITIQPTGDWWQVKDADVTTTGNLRSSILVAGDPFNLEGDGGFPGLPIYSETAATANFGQGKVSEKEWIAQTDIQDSSYLGFNYDYFRRLIPFDIEDEAESPEALITGNIDLADDGFYYDGYYWYTTEEEDGLTISSDVELSNRKDIVFVDGNLEIQGNIALSNAFLMFIVKGNITIDHDVTSLEGVYFADGTFSSGSDTDDESLNVTGSVVALGGVNLERDLSDNILPSEYFTYSPSLLMQIPYLFGDRKMRWREVAP